MMIFRNLLLELNRSLPFMTIWILCVEGKCCLSIAILLCACGYSGIQSVHTVFWFILCVSLTRQVPVSLLHGH